MIKADNPVIPGFNPDPSICCAEGVYYVVNSSFGYFPGIPVYRSRDLCNFQLIGNALDRPSQLELSGCSSSEGIFAPTIRYHEGVFYIVSTLVPKGGNFIITAKNPAGPWSEPVFLDAEGIDPSLFFDDDGQCWFCGSRPAPGAKYFGDNEIFVQRLDINKLKLAGESVSVWRGAFRNAVWPEGPHIYKVEGMYYLITAEGGTELHHSVMAARSSSVTGPYEGCPDNPIFTHRHLGRSAPVVGVGHGDMICAGGCWYMLLLGSRRERGHTLLGRETFLARVDWLEGWPVVNAGLGALEKNPPLPLPCHPAPRQPQRYDFARGIPPEFMALRSLPEVVPGEDGFDIMAKAPCCLVKRMSSHYLRVRASLTLTSGEAGLALLQSEENNLRLVLARSGESCHVRAVKAEKREKQETLLLEAPAFCCAELEISVSGLRAGFYLDGVLLGEADIAFLSTESAGGFTGCTAGMYATAPAHFDWFELL